MRPDIRLLVSSHDARNLLNQVSSKRSSPSGRRFTTPVDVTADDGLQRSGPQPGTATCPIHVIKPQLVVEPLFGPGGI